MYSGIGERLPVIIEAILGVTLNICSLYLLNLVILFYSFVLGKKILTTPLLIGAGYIYTYKLFYLKSN
jgi:hypothetical protein